MARTEDVLAYLYHRYPRPSQLSDARLGLMLYLADWRSAILYNIPISDSRWRLDDGGSLLHRAGRTDDPAWEDLRMAFRDWASRGDPATLRPEDRDVLDHVIATSYGRSWIDLVRLVNSTFPVLTQPWRTTMNLGQLAQSYLRYYRPMFLGG